MTVDVGTRSVKLVQFSADCAKLVDAARADLPAVDLKALSAEKYAEYLAAAIARARDGRTFRGKDIVLGLTDRELFVQNIRVARCEGAELERLWGPKRYLQFYFASVLTAAATQIVVTALVGSGVPTVGASGGLYGLLLAFGLMFPNRIIMPLFPPIPMKARTFVIVFGGLALLFGFSGSVSGVAHFAHLGGMLGGWLMIQYRRGGFPFKG